VDINMPPGMDGFELCEELHEFSDLPIIMLTAVDEEETVIQALEQFAEDYITKPFDLGELLARVRRVIRRIGSFRGSLDPAVSVDEHMQVNFPKCEITMDGAAVALTPTETKLLYILMRSAGDILKASFIMRRLWPEEIPNEGKLRVNVHRLRDKIETGGSGHHYIVSHRGVGYQFMSAPTDVPI
jgi:DNA-binding response OmpR family regulator